ncbi:MAG: hypothetical protein ACR2QJ_00325 [Geminicoccaceae bacterium]
MAFRIIGIMTLGTLAACADLPTTDSVPDDFGVAVRSNMQAQIIAKQGEVTALGPAPGVRRAIAVGRYQTDQVEQPVEIYTRSE